jgi:hypothetical protein
MKTRLLLLAAILLLVCMPFACDCSEEVSPVTTVGVFEVYGDGVTLTGHLDTMVGASSGEVWFSVSIKTGQGTGTFLVETPKQTLTAPGEFSYRLTGLDPNTTYYFYTRAKGDNWDKERSGEAFYFNIAELTGPH